LGPIACRTEGKDGSKGRGKITLGNEVRIGRDILKDRKNRGKKKNSIRERWTREKGGKSFKK